MLQYSHGNPTRNGNYACRVGTSTEYGNLRDQLLTYIDGVWYWLETSDPLLPKKIPYRSPVWGWIGPLPRAAPPLTLPPPVETSKTASKQPG